jgi:hypothetical protein
LDLGSHTKLSIAANVPALYHPQVNRYTCNLKPARVREQLPDNGEAIYLMKPANGGVAVTEVKVRQPLGVTLRDMKERRPRLAVKAFEEFVRDTGPEKFAGVAERLSDQPEWQPILRRIRRRALPRTDRLVRLAVTAALYAIADERGERALNAVVAKQQNRPVSHVRDDIRRARAAGLLTPGRGHGHGGGKLTSKAKELLNVWAYPPTAEGRGTAFDAMVVTKENKK